MNTITLYGGTDVYELRGELLAHSSGENGLKRPNGQWHVIRVYKTEGGKHVISILFRSRFKHERQADWVFVCNTLEEAAERLHAFDPLAGVVGFSPPREESGHYKEMYDARQGVLMRQIQVRYEQQVAAVLAECGVVVRVD